MILDFGTNLEMLTNLRKKSVANGNEIDGEREYLRKGSIARKANLEINSISDYDSESDSFEDAIEPDLENK